MSVCIPCRLYSPKSDGNGCCAICKGEITSTPYRWSPPKRNNLRAWKRIANGEWLWDRRRVRRGRRNRGPSSDTKTVREFVMEWVEVEGRYGFRKHYIPGTEREVPDDRKKPEVDLGG